MQIGDECDTYESISTVLYNKSSITVFLMYLGGTYLRFHLISAINFYYVINKLIILIYNTH
jgi:hypothetical protein